MKGCQAWLGALLVCALATDASAQWIRYPTTGIPRLADGTADLTAPAPRTPDGWPDLSGIWVMVPDILFDPIEGMPAAREFGNIGVSLPGGLPYQPWAGEAVKVNRADDRRGDPLTACLPIGLVRSHTFTMYRQIVQVPGRIVILNEHNASFRQIFTDDRPLPIDPNPSWNGYSSAKWEGDTLVVRTTGFRDDLWLDAFGSPITRAGTTVERIRRHNLGELQIELTVDDPKAYTRPWTVTLRQRLVVDTELLDHICLENEKSRAQILSARVHEQAREIIERFVSAYESADLEQLLSTFDNAATVFAEGDPVTAASGKAAIRQFFNALFQTPGRTPVLQLENMSVHAAGEMAIVTLPLRTGSADKATTGWTFVMRKVVDRWVIVHYHA